MISSSAASQRNFAAVAGILEQGRNDGEFRRSVDPAAVAMLLGAAAIFFQLP